MNVLAIDTSNQLLGVALWKDNELKAEYTANIKRNHSIGLMPSINQLMKETDTSPKDLDRIAVAKGPGSYTGVRIGLATAKTLAWTLNIPIVAISSLELLARNIHNDKNYVSPFFDARRGLVYTGLYQRDINDMKLVEKDCNILMTDWLTELQKLSSPVVFLSQDLEQHKKTIEEYLGENAVFPEPLLHFPRAGELAYLATKREADQTHTLTPNYIRMVEAEAKWLEKQKQDRSNNE